MRNRLNLTIEPLGNAKLLNHKSFLILGAIDLNLEIKLAGSLFQYVDHMLETWRRKSRVKSRQGIQEKDGLIKLEDILAKISVYSLLLI